MRTNRYVAAQKAAPKVFTWAYEYFVKLDAVYAFNCWDISDDSK